MNLKQLNENTPKVTEIVSVFDHEIFALSLESIFVFDCFSMKHCSNIFKFFLKILTASSPLKNVNDSPKSQYPEIDFNKISNTIHKTYIGLTGMLQGFQKYIA